METTTTKCTDLSYLDDRTNSDGVLKMKIITLYLKQTPTLLENMKQGWVQQDWNLVYANVHKMIPSFVVVGISRDFENMARRIQEYAGTQTHTECIEDLVLQIETVCTQAYQELTQEYNILENTH